MEQIVFDAEDDGSGQWEFVSDRVMGGISIGALSVETVGGRRALRLTGNVSTANDGGFLQMARDNNGAADWTGLVFDVFGNGESYNVHLRTTDLDHPWQSYRTSFVAGPDWSRQTVGFDAFVPHRTDTGFEPSRLNRIGFVAIGREFQADLSLSRLAFRR